jgi:type I restriction enzyme M protein
MSIVPLPKEAIDTELWKEFLQLHGVEDIAVLTDLVLGLLYLALLDRPLYAPSWDGIVAAEERRLFEAVEHASLDHVPALNSLYHACDAIRQDVYAVGRLAKIIELVDRVRRSGQGAEVFDFLLDRFAAIAGRRDAAVHTPAALVNLMVTLIAPESSVHLFDPCCGSGEFLVGAAKFITASGGNIEGASFTGHALSERSALLTYMNLRLHGVHADLEVHGNKILPGNNQVAGTRNFSAIISNPPFDLKDPMLAAAGFQGRYGPLPKKRPSFAWLQYMASSLADGGRAAVVMPNGSLVRQGAEGNVRAKMIEEGIIEAVITLPPRMFSSTGVPVTVWLLSKSAERNRPEILLIDASDLGHMISRSQSSLSRASQSQIADTSARWRSDDGYASVQGFSASVAVSHIREHNYILNPARYVGTKTSLDMPSSSLQELRNELTRLDWRAEEVDEMADRQLDRIQSWIL